MVGTDLLKTIIDGYLPFSFRKLAVQVTGTTVVGKIIAPAPTPRLQLRFTRDLCLFWIYDLQVRTTGYLTGWAHPERII